MNRKIIGICIMTLLVGPSVFSVSACTGFTASDENLVLVGSNEDWDNYNYNIRFFPPKDGKNGMMFFEIPFNDPAQEAELTILPIAGMNDKGLWYDLYLTPILLPENSSNKPYFTNSDYYYKDNLAEYLLSEF